MTLEVRGMDEFIRGIKKADAQLPKEVTKAHKVISTKVAGKAADRVSGLSSPRSSSAAAGIKPRAGQKYARIVVSGPFALAAVMGTKVHPVFGRRVLASSMARRVWADWVGNDWTPEEGLYGVSPVIADAMPGIIDTYADAIYAALKSAYPE